MEESIGPVFEFCNENCSPNSQWKKNPSNVHNINGNSRIWKKNIPEHISGLVIAFNQLIDWYLKKISISLVIDIWFF